MSNRNISGEGSFPLPLHIKTDESVKVRYVFFPRDMKKTQIFGKPPHGSPNPYPIHSPTPRLTTHHAIRNMTNMRKE